MSRHCWECIENSRARDKDSDARDVVKLSGVRELYAAIVSVDHRSAVGTGVGNGGCRDEDVQGTVL